MIPISKNLLKIYINHKKYLLWLEREEHGYFQNSSEHSKSTHINHDKCTSHFWQK